MSIKTLRKRIAITATTALLAGALSIVVAPAAQAHSAVGGTNTLTNVGQIAGNGTDQTNNTQAGEAGSLFTAIQTNTGAAAVASVTSETGPCGNADDNGKSKGLLYKDSSSGIAQSATMLAGGVLSLYTCSATNVSFKASAGSFSSPAGGTVADTAYSWTYNSTNTQVWQEAVVGAITSGTSNGVLWTAPTTVGTYTVSLYTGFYTTSSATQVVATADSGVTPPTLSGNITVTVVATDGGGSYSATNSFCKAARGTSTATSNVDDTSIAPSGEDYSVDIALRDAYSANLSSSGALTASATNGALLAYGASAGTTPVAGTATSVVTNASGSNATFRVSRATAGVPLTTTVTISYGGTVVCTKTVSLGGNAATLTISTVGVQDLSASTGNSKWLGSTESTNGTFYVQAKDSAGNTVTTPSTAGTFGVEASTLGTTVTNVTFPRVATATSSTDPNSAAVGVHACGPVAGTQKGVVINYTLANGTVIKAAPVDLSCSNDPALVSAGFDKAKYLAGDVATLTITLKDNKGNAANNVIGLGAHTVSVPGMTLVSTTGASDAVAKAGGVVTYTYTVGQTAGKYAAVIDFTGATTELAVYSKVQTPSYEITTGGDTTTNADVLKSIVALIASINKQIQALQKLILKR